jgi:hypothetical protein
VEGAGCRLGSRRVTCTRTVQAELNELPSQCEIIYMLICILTARDVLSNALLNGSGRLEQ